MPAAQAAKAGGLSEGGRPENADGKDGSRVFRSGNPRLTKRFGRRPHASTAVEGVSLHVGEGQVYGLLGPNGAGKSTTLKMLCGMLRPTGGSIMFEGRPWQRDDLYRIGSLIETPPLYPNLTAAENLDVRCTLLGIPRGRIAETLEAVGLAHTGRKRAGQFSMG